jgi:hypothetical protein
VAGAPTEFYLQFMVKDLTGCEFCKWR